MRVFLSSSFRSPQSPPLKVTSVIRLLNTLSHQSVSMTWYRRLFLCSAAAVAAILLLRFRSLSSSKAERLALLKPNANHNAYMLNCRQT